jgi:preprotein translocase SecE subunit
VARQTRSQRRARREAREASSPAAPAAPRPRVSQTAAPAGDGGARVEAAPQQQREPRGNRLFRFIGECVAELKKVDWPNQTQVVTGTTVVLVACVIVGFYLYLNDEVWKRVVEHVFLR